MMTMSWHHEASLTWENLINYQGIFIFKKINSLIFKFNCFLDGVSMCTWVLMCILGM